MAEAERDACGIGFVADARGTPSHAIVELALEALRRLRHRGAMAADARTGDGAGLLLPLSPGLFGDAGVAMGFLPPGREVQARAVVEEGLVREGLQPVGWRDVPIDPGALGRHARRTLPHVAQALFRPPAEGDPERAAFRARKRIERAARRERLPLYVASCSTRTVTYKALCAADQLAAFYPDLTDPQVEVPLVVFHQRYSTNTAPTWERAQPFRLLCHNGEINTIAGNVNRMRSREGRLGLPTPRDEDLLRPAIDEGGSDSAMLDDAADLLVREGGFDLRRAMAMLVPAAWEHDPDLTEEVRGFYRWHASLMEPWDGPAALIFTDGVGVGAALDRNGLRPLRYVLCDDGLVACASEAGVVDLAGRGAVRRGKLGPGDMVFVDPREGGFQADPVGRVAARRPYGAWAEEHRVRRPAGHPASVAVPEDLLRLQVAHGYTREDNQLIVRQAAAQGKEPTFSMGDDTPIPPFGSHRRPVYAFLKQRFAQVTNPAMDHLRERQVMSLSTLLGPRDPLLWERPEAAALIELDTFFLLRPLAGTHLDATWEAAAGPSGLRPALDRLADDAVRAAAHGSGILVVTDEAVGPERAPIPAVLAVGAVNAALLRAGHRTRTSIVVRSDDARESHHFACLLGYGADAVYPRLALATVAAMALDRRRDGLGPVEEAVQRYRAAIEEGVLKVLSKLGISCLDSYRGAQTFDALGLAPEVVEVCLPGTPSPIGGLGFEELAADVLARHREAYGAPAPALPNPGVVRFLRGGEYHATNPAVVRALHLWVDPGLERLRSTAAAGAEEAGAAGNGDRTPGGDSLGRGDGGSLGGNGDRPDHIPDPVAVALRRAARDGDPAGYRRFSELVSSRPPTAPRDLLRPVAAGPPVPLDEVEGASEILKRFSAGAVSHGAISKEAHEALAVALNRIGGRSNTGEGGEDPARYRTERNSRIKQVASGRFGVTPEYCAFAEELQIKIAQGSKPGEGGQLPGHKVTEEIARLRHTQPGVALISPAPHHDIYSIEDLAQLIFDLKQVNPAAAVSVKLVAEAGVGTIAAGVAKGLAEVVHISGADGGTGASPLSSIKNAGLPWEVGLAETQRVLSEEGLRGRVRVRVDGGFKNGRDVLVAALLGADEFSFGTSALVALGCIMVRTCHLDTCPVGIATQRPDLRARFAGTPEMVAGYLTAVAEEVRGLLASLGLRSMDEAVGRTELLRQADAPARAGSVDLSPMLLPPGGERRFVGPVRFQRQRSDLGDRLFRDAWPAVRHGRVVELEYPIRNTDRTVGARLGGAVGREFGQGPPPGRAVVTFRGTAGQSFGAFLAGGIDLRLVGEANDYVAKGMGGGRIVIVPPPDDGGDPWLAGNTVLYGATGGELYVAGRAGERFAVRNSGATAVVEGVGDHCAEYMTGGTVVVLGPAGPNLAAGMTGGRVYLHDPHGTATERVNRELVEVRAMDADEGAILRELLERHAALTGSPRAAAALDRWDREAGRFRVVAPRGDVAAISQRNEGTLKAARA